MQRACEPLFSEDLAAFPCLAILGPRLCGKTTLAGSLPADWRRFAPERGSDRDLVARGLGVSPPTARDYFEIAQGTFLWRRLPPYGKQATKRLVKHSKGHLRDSGLLHRLLHLANRRCRYGLVITNDSEPRLLDEAIVAIPFSHL